VTSYFRHLTNIVVVIIVFLANVSAQDLSLERSTHNLTRLLLQFELPKEEVVVDGFVKKVSGLEIDYHSPLQHRLTALLSRATDGKSFVAWKSDIIPANAEYIHLLWFAGLGANLGENHFDLCVNDVSILTFSSRSEKKWSVSGSNGSILRFYANFIDNVGDLFGVMHLTIPKKVIGSSKFLEFRVTGRKENSSAWYMIFMYNDLTKLLERTKNQGYWYTIEKQNEGSKATFRTTINFMGKKLQLSDGAEIVLIEENHMAYAEISAFDLKQIPLIVKLDGRVIDEIHSFSADASGSIYYEDGRVVSRRFHSTDSEQLIEVGTSFNFSFVENLNALYNKSMEDATLELITSSHQDIAWMDDPLACKIMRDTLIISPAIDLLRKYPDYHYSAEQALMLYEYLDRHPKMLPEIQKYSKAGRLEWGASFNQPYEGMYYGESLVRQFYLGRKWLKKALPGYNPKIYFNIDVPGRTRQMPQIAKKCGVDFMIISRHEKGYYFWESPDGSQIGVHSPGHYHLASDFLRQSVDVALMEIPRHIASIEDDFKKYQFPYTFPILLSSDMSSPKDMSELFQAWHHLKIISTNGASEATQKLPQWRYNNFQPVMEKLFKEGKNIPVIKGERPNVWLYIHGPTHHWAIKASREGGRMLPVAESFNAIAAILNNDWDSYPYAAFAKAWEAQIFPDHGWGGNDGHVTDQLFLDKSRYSRDEAKRLLGNALSTIGSLIGTNSKKGKALVVFNPLSWIRDGFVKKSLILDRGEFKSISIIDEDNNPIDCLIYKNEIYDDGSLKSVDALFLAKGIPSIGYKTYYIQNREGRQISRKLVAGNKVNKYENDFYKIEFAHGGIKQIYDKQLKQDIVKSDKYLFGELIALKSVGNGAG